MYKAPYDTCPILSIGDETGYTPCLNERCAWYHLTETDGGACAILNIAAALSEKEESRNEEA